MVKEVEFYRKKLDNGITVLFEKRKIPVIAVSTSVKFGAQYESEKIKGISHFIEHLVFKGTKTRTVTEIPTSSSLRLCSRHIVCSRASGTTTKRIVG